MLDEAIIVAWQTAAQELGIELVAPYALRLANGNTIEVEVFLPHFGGPRGTILVPMSDHVRCRQAQTSNHFVSRLGDGRRYFDEDNFRATLDDLGWYGPEARRPSWYTGKAWGQVPSNPALQRTNASVASLPLAFAAERQYRWADTMRSWRRVRDLLVSNYGRADGWYVELDDKRVAELTRVNCEDMFWDSYEVSVDTYDASQIRDDTLWAAARFSFRNRRTGEPVATAFCGGTPPFVRNGRVRIRGLYLAANTFAERACLRVLKILHPRSA